MGDDTERGPREFATTEWSLVLAAQSDDASASRAQEALEALCRAYWYPLYAFVRRRGYTADEAQDLTQAFFLKIIETRGVAAADPARGRFRSYLLGALKHFLVNQWHRARARKRGGAISFVEFDGLEPERRYASEPRTLEDPAAAYDRAWAQETVARVLGQLRREARERGKLPLFEALESSLTGDEPDRRALAERLETTPGALKVAIHRLRQRYRALLRDEIARTVSDPSEVDAEIRHLIAALRRMTDADP